MKSSKILKILIYLAALAALIVAGINAFAGFMNASPEGKIAFVGAGILLILAFGIYRKSRIASGFTLAFYLYGRLGVAVAHQGHFLEPVALVFTILFLAGFVSTILWHRRPLS